MPRRRSAHREDPNYSPSGRRYSLEPGSPVSRSSRLESDSFTPSREFSLRATTPDARQLHDTLRAASESPTKARPASRLSFSNQSSSTPSPPVQHTISTTSTPNAPSLNPAIVTEESSPLEQSDRGFSFFRYPRLSNLTGFGNRKGESSVPSSPQHEDTLDNESVISWRLERDLHQDNLQRKRREEFDVEEFQAEEQAEEFDDADTSQGQTIRAPPRRLSGLTWAVDTTNPPSSPESPEVRTAAARTVISGRVEPDESDVSHESSVKPRKTVVPPVDLPRAPPRLIRKESYGQIPWSLVALAILVPVAVVTLYFFSDNLAMLSNPFGRRPDRYQGYQPLNETEGRIIKQLTGEVDKLEMQLSSVSRDVHRLNSEQRRVVEQITAVQPMPETISKINFLSPGLGARVDPLLTSPSIGVRRTLLRRISEKALGYRLPQPNRPEVALQPWEDIGDCWCGAPGTSGQAQLAVHLGQRAVLDEVVVEHIPFGASPRPDIAPREMELWARFKPHHGQHDILQSTTETPVTSKSGKLGWFGRATSRSSSAPPSSHTPSGPHSVSSLLKIIMTTLHNAYPSEPESAYSNDRLLGPSFFRLGKWEYDQMAESVQHFALDAIVDLPMLRVDKVVIRVKTNWGGNHTCLYRVKLHGHL